MSRQSLDDLKPLLPESTTSAGSLEKEYSSNAGPKLRGLCRPIPLISFLMVSVLLNMALVVRPVDVGRRCTSDQTLYSKWNRPWIIIEFYVTRNLAPVQDILEYETRLFSPALANISQYSGPPSEAVDQAWEDLYGCESFSVIALDTCR